ncbi:MAG: hypothetical protein ACI8UO_006209 [Verrucomicrobiales bacterium]|jgi:hypothetical protein
MATSRSVARSSRRTVLLSHRSHDLGCAPPTFFLTFFSTEAQSFFEDLPTGDGFIKRSKFGDHCFEFFGVFVFESLSLVEQPVPKN